jgi:DNA-directed RNA polymerase subunit RPC12/RpoP
MIEFPCSSCGNSFRVVDQHAGRLVNCPDCGLQLQVPTAAPAPVRSARPAVPVPEESCQGFTSPLEGNDAPSNARTWLLGACAFAIFLSTALVVGVSLWAISAFRETTTNKKAIAAKGAIGSSKDTQRSAPSKAIELQVHHKDVDLRMPGANAPTEGLSTTATGDTQGVKKSDARAGVQAQSEVDQRAEEKRREKQKRLAALDKKEAAELTAVDQQIASVKEKIANADRVMHNMLDQKGKLDRIQSGPVPSFRDKAQLDFDAQQQWLQYVKAYKDTRENLQRELSTLQEVESRYGTAFNGRAYRLL